MNLQQKFQDLTDELKSMLKESWETGYQEGKDASDRDWSDEVDSLQVELDEFRKDAERLAWVESFVEFDDAIALLKKHLEHTPDLRKAIDQARGQWG